MTRVSLLKRIKDLTDSVAWGEFDHIYRPILRRFARASGLDHEAAEEVAQECMINIAEHIGGFEYDPRRGSFRGWLLTMTNNVVRTRLRKRQPATVDADRLDRLASPHGNPGDLFESLWIQEHLRACLHAVRKTASQEAFVAYEMYVLRGMSAEEVCAKLNLNPNQLYQIKFRINRRVLQQFRELVGDEQASTWLSTDWQRKPG